MHVGEADARASEPVEVRRADSRGAVAAEVAVTEVIGVDEHDIRGCSYKGEGGRDWCGRLRLVGSFLDYCLARWAGRVRTPVRLTLRGAEKGIQLESGYAILRSSPAMSPFPISEPGL